MYMRIAVNGQSLEGNRTGVGRVLFNLLKHWAKEGEHEFLLYFKKEIPADLPQSEKFQAKITGQKSDLLFNQWTLPRAAKKDGAEVLFCPAYQIPILFSLKTVLFIHDIIYEARPEWYNWNSRAEKLIFRRIFRRSAGKAGKIIVPSLTTKEEAEKFYGVAPEKIKVCFLAVDDFFINGKITPGEIEKTKKKFGLSGKYILSGGSIFVRRHPYELIRAFGEFLKTHGDYQLIFFGKDYLGAEEKLDEKIGKFNTLFGGSKIIRKNFVEDQDLLALYEGANIFVSISDYEGFGLPPLEAMSRGVPVIVSAQGALQEIAGEAAYLIKDNNSAAEIAAALKELAENSELREELVEKGRKRVREFSWEKCAQDALGAISGA